MSKLVDKERLAKLAKALDARAKAAVKAEEERALAAEQAIEAKADANAAAINAINNTETGILKQAKDYADGVANTEKLRAEEQEGLLADRIETLEGIVGSEAEGAFGEVKAAVADNKAAIVKLNGKADEEGSVAKAVADAVKVEKDRAEGVEAGFETRIAANEAFVTAQPAKDEKQDQRLALLEEMMGLGGETGDKTAIEELQESITNLKTDLQKEIDDDVLVETNRAVAKENELDAAIKAEAQTARTAEKANADEIAKQKDAAQAGTLANKIAANVTAIEKEAADRATAVSGEATARENADKALAERLDVIQGADTVEGSIAKAEKDAKDYADELIAGVNTAAGNLEDRVEANEAKLAGLEKTTVQAAIDQAEADAKAHAEQKIADLVDSAPDAMNTLKELATAINANKGVYDAYVEQHATAMATMKSDLQKEIDADVKVVADDLAKQKDAAQEGTLAKKIADEVARADAEEKAIRAAFAAEDAKLAGQIKAVEEMLGVDSGDGKVGAFAQVQADISALKETVGDAEEGLVKDVADLKAADVTLQNNIDLKVEQSDYNAKVAELANADTALGNRIAVFEAGGASDVAAKEVRLAAAEKDIDALQAFMNGHSHEALQQAITAETKEGGARDVAIKAAIDKEVTDRNKAIEDELKAYSDTAAVKAMLTNVINSLGLAIEDNKLQLTLGTSDYVIKEVELDLATDADIDAIIAGLDA